MNPPSQQETNPAAASLAVLLAMKLRLLRNTVSVGVRRHRWRIVAGTAVVALLCAMLYVLLTAVLAWLQQRQLESILAIEYIFHFFFIAVMAMLWLSSALLSYSGLFGRDEPAYLLVAPIEAWHFVSVKFVEAFVLSSWSLLLLGLPLLLAMNRVYALGAPFFPLFLAGFVALALISAAWGLLTAYVVARWVPRRAVTLLLVGFGVVLVILGAAATHRWAAHRTDYTNWLKEFYGRLRLARSAFLPSTWMSQFTIEAGRGDYRQALFYLAVLAANAAFFIWLSIRIVAADFSAALMRASEGCARRVRLAGHLTASLSRLVFFWLPAQLRMMILKDLRCFLRDANQWSQMGILAALLSLYVVNLPRLNVRVLGEYAPVVVPFLNLAAISLILATFTGRFIFPQVSLEAGQMWLMATLPIARGRIVSSKFISALTVTLAAAGVVVGTSVWMLQMEPLWAAVQVLFAAAICVGLCGLAVGMGAWLPSFEEKSSARIASGLGGMLNLVSSMMWVTLVNLVNGLICREAFGSTASRRIVPAAVVAVAGIWAVAAVLAWAAMAVGTRSLASRDL
jgi:ABC-2 type transport system permease protein